MILLSSNLCVLPNKMKTVFRRIESLKAEVEYWIGESAQDNFNIIDEADANDLWFHLGDGESSCHVIARMPEDAPDKKGLRQIVIQGASLCKENSRRKSAKNVTIIYTRIENIEKTKVVGSVLSRNAKTLQL